MNATPRLVARLVGVTVAMFLFGVFAMPPLYDKFCEITGIGEAAIEVADSAPLVSTTDRTVKVRFDATTNSGLNWAFKPALPSAQVQVGKAATAAYVVTNQEAAALAGRAVFNVTPPEAARYFVKTQCFCFSRQELAGGETREMPVYFYIKEDLPDTIEELTLAYTFFKIDEEAAPAAP